MNKELSDYLEDLKSKPLFEYGLVELAEKIDNISDLYFNTKLKDEKKIIQSVYTKMIDRTHELAGRKIYKQLITRD